MSLADRLREPSTWAALGVLSAVMGHQVPAELIGAGPDLFALACDLVAGVCGVVGVGMREQSRPDR